MYSIGSWDFFLHLDSWLGRVSVISFTAWRQKIILSISFAVSLPHHHILYFAFSLPCYASSSFSSSPLSDGAAWLSRVRLDSVRVRRGSVRVRRGSVRVRRCSVRMWHGLVRVRRCSVRVWRVSVRMRRGPVGCGVAQLRCGVACLGSGVAQ
jgi:hypothetical protein